MLRIDFTYRLTRSVFLSLYTLNQCPVDPGHITVDVSGVEVVVKHGPHVEDHLPGVGRKLQHSVVVFQSHAVTLFRDKARQLLHPGPDIAIDGVGLHVDPSNSPQEFKHHLNGDNCSLDETRNNHGVFFLSFFVSELIGRCFLDSF